MLLCNFANIRYASMWTTYVSFVCVFISLRKVIVSREWTKRKWIVFFFAKVNVNRENTLLKLSLNMSSAENAFVAVVCRY